MARPVLDASVALAYLGREAGWEESEAWLKDGVMLMVNLAEIVQTLLRRKVSQQTARAAIDGLSLSLVRLDQTMAMDAGAIPQSLVKGGLSLADRCCLAYARQMKVPAVTADRAWSDLADTLNAEIIQIR